MSLFISPASRHCWVVTRHHHRHLLMMIVIITDTNGGFHRRLPRRRRLRRGLCIQGWAHERPGVPARSMLTSRILCMGALMASARWLRRA